MTTKQALQSAIIAFERIYETYGIDHFYVGGVEVADKCKSALAELESVEPVAWMAEDGRVANVHQKSVMHNITSDNYNIPLFTSPQTREWVGIHEEDIMRLAGEVYKNGGWDIEFANAIEQKIKDLNCGR